MTTLSPTHTVDVRRIQPRDRHPLIFTTFRRLSAGESMELVNDHDPRPLYYHFQAELPGKFTWDYLENGPDTWRVSIRRLDASEVDPHAGGHCCGGGSCSGA